MASQSRCSICGDFDSNRIYLCVECKKKQLEQFEVKERFLLLNGERSRPRQANVVKQLNLFGDDNNTV